MLNKFVCFNWKTHLIVGFLIRVLLIIYGVYHDQKSLVPYTDIDYKVFTDASRHVLNNKSPFDRHTYRYTPLLAIFLIPNVIFHHSFGKILFSITDVIVAYLIRLIVDKSQLKYESYRKKHDKTNGNGHSSNIPIIFWLYNPLTIAISTRGNCDSIAVCLVLVTLYLLQNTKHYFIAGLFHGISIHFRLYPIIYTLSYFMYLSGFSYYLTNATEVGKVDKEMRERPKYEKRTIFKKSYLLYLWPNFDQIQFIFGCFLSFFALTSLFYYFYSYKFLYETYLYHFTRTDVKHNFSLYFYLQYLTAWIKNVGLWKKVLITLPQIVLLAIFSVRYGLNRVSLNFCVLLQTIVMVIYNTVLTSQYFVWILAVLPLSLWQINMTVKKAFFLFFIWFAAQLSWLLPAYLLEFHGQNTFLFIWLESVSFFCANIAILGRLIRHFMSGQIL